MNKSVLVTIIVYRNNINKKAISTIIAPGGSYHCCTVLL